MASRWIFDKNLLKAIITIYVGGSCWRSPNKCPRIQRVGDHVFTAPRHLLWPLPHVISCQDIPHRQRLSSSPGGATYGDRHSARAEEVFFLKMKAIDLMQKPFCACVCTRVCVCVRVHVYVYDKYRCVCVCMCVLLNLWRRSRQSQRINNASLDELPRFWTNSSRSMLSKWQKVELLYALSGNMNPTGKSSLNGGLSFHLFVCACVCVCVCVCVLSFLFT